MEGNIVTGNLAHSFNFKADKTAVLENNVKVTEKAFRERFDALLKVIEKKFGKFHPVAQYGRVGVEKGGN